MINKNDNIAVIQKNKAIGLKTIQEYLAYFTRNTAGVYHFQEIPESVEEFQNSLASRGDMLGIRRVNISGNLNTIDPAVERKHETVLDAIERVADYFGGYKFEMVIKKADKNAPDLTQDAIFDLISDITQGASDLETASIVYKDEEQPRQSPLDLMNNRKKMKFEFELDENKIIRHEALVRAILEQYQRG